MPKVSLSMLLSGLTEPESLGQPLPEKTRRVIVGGVGGAARVRRGRARKRGVRMMDSVWGDGFKEKVDLRGGAAEGLGEFVKMAVEKKL